MKTLLSVVSVAGLVAAGFTCQQQLGGDQRPGPPPQRHADGQRQGPPGGPFLDLFDTDKNEELSTKEIEAAVGILKKLDRNSDGKLTREELPRPPRPEDGDGHNEVRPPRPGDDERGSNRPQRPGADGDSGGSTALNAATGTVLLRGGYETDRRDGGRPVALIAAALGVESQVFRDAFSKVQPARGGSPSDERASMNKQVLMDALGKHGVTNDRLDTVSNYYRYRPQSGSLWKHTAARATAIVKGGKVTRFKITNAGSGYMVAPTVTVAGHPNLRVKATIAFSTEFQKNGRITSLKVVD